MPVWRIVDIKLPISLRAKEAQREPWGSRGQPPSKALGRPLWARGGGETAVGDAEGGELMSITHVAFSPYLKHAGKIHVT